MGRIQSSVGLITGVPIEDTVDQLIGISARPRDLLVDRTEGLREQRVAVTELTALVIGVQFSIERLGKESLFEQKQIASSNEEVISATITGTPNAGTYDFTPVRQAQQQQLLSRGFAENDEPLGAGEISFRFGGFVQKGHLLDDFNHGDGVERGKIRITDRSGSSAQIDLRFALTVDDVINTINSNVDINVTAFADGDRFRLQDNTGQTVSNLQVREVGLGRTAADLGLSNVDVTSDVALGDDIVHLFDGLALSALNDGGGIALRKGVADLEVSFQDGSTPLQIEFFAQTKGPTASSVTTEAANGVNAQLTLDSLGTGEEWDGYEVIIEDDEEITLGNETVEVDTVAKEIRFKIDAGQTRAVHLVSAVNNDAEASALFTASLPAGGDGTGVVDVADTGETKGGAIEFANEKTLGELLATINAADPARLRAQVSADGDSIELIDLTSGGGTFAVTSLFGGSAAEDLGINVAATSGVITSRRRFAGLDTVLLDSLSGGQGLGTLGQISLTDRAGSTATVDLSAAQTLTDVLQAINAAGVGITAAVNGAGNGIELTDTTTGTGNLVVASADSTGTADKFGIAVDDAVDSINSGSLNRKTLHKQTKLDDFNNGRGVGSGSFLITDSNGQVGAVNLTVSGAETIGEVIDVINGLSIDVEARINDTGDGILLVDTAGGAGAFSVADVGNGTVATDLKLAGTGVTQDINGVPAQVIDGATTLRIELDDDDTLKDLVTKINDANGDVAASIFNSGSGSRPYRLSLVSQITGAAGEVLIDGSALGIEFQELVAAQDALLMVGPADAPIAGALATSSSNEFDSLIDGVTINVLGTSSEPVTIDVTQTEQPIASALNLFVEQFNKLQAKLEELTFFDENDATAGLLFGSSEVLRIEFDLSNALTSRYFGLGSIQSLEEVGLSLNGKGQLEFDESKFKDQYDENRDAVEKFFADDEVGVAKKIEDVAKQLAGPDNSVLLSRSLALQQTIEINDARIAALTEALDDERDSLLLEFFRLETAIGRMQNNLSAVSQIQGIPPLVSLNR